MDTIELKIQQLKADRNAIILAHNYQLSDIQDVADFVGDSLELSQKAAKTEAAVIVFCGVHFMAETAAILSPEKKVLLPDEHAGCPMADMINADQLRQLKQKHPKAVVVCYVNSSAAVKAESDYCCTSANAVKIVKSLNKAEEIIFVPDQYLGQYVAEQTGRELILWPGYCPTHARIMESDIETLKRQHPNTCVMVHPECRKSIRDLADAVLSTSSMCRYPKESEADSFIVGTETGILYRLRKEYPNKTFYPVGERAICPNMKRTTLEKVLWSLEQMQPVIWVPHQVAEKARKAISNMLIS